MTRTLTDMTPDERAACVGRWAEVRHRLVIIAEIHERIGDAHVFHVETSTSEWHPLPDITPRLDLPRAWTPDGEPCLAGADALDAVERVRDVLDQLDKHSDAAYLAYKTNPENTRLDGQAMAYEQAVVLIQRALGGTP